jgi:hypothetical protein
MAGAQAPLRAAVTSARAAGDPSRAAEALWWGLALALVPVYTSVFPLWLRLSEALPEAIAGSVPAALAVALLGVLVVRGHRRLQRRAPAAVAWLGAALALGGLAYALADPAFPAKRIHLFQYALLALVVRRALAAGIGDPLLVPASAAVAGLLGIHDELLQGLHPDRFFGLPDIAVNAVSAGAGACLGAALADSGGGTTPRLRPREAIAAALALAALAALIAGLAGHGIDSLPAWSWLPPAAALPAWLILSRGGPGARLATIVVWLAAGAIVEPTIARLAGLPFA